MQKKVLSLNFNNKTAQLFKANDSVLVELRPEYEMVNSCRFSNVDEKKHIINDIGAAILRANIKRYGPFVNSLDYFIKRREIGHYFIGPDDEQISEFPRFYGRNYMKWNVLEQKIYVGSCDAYPAEEEALEQLGDNRYKGIALHTVAQAIYYYNILAEQTNQNLDSHVVHLLATPYAYYKHIYHRYGFQASQNLEQLVMQEEAENIARYFYPMHLTVQAMREFMEKYQMDMGGLPL